MRGAKKLIEKYLDAMQLDDKIFSEILLFP
jgi:hypothetical protein